MVSHDNSSSSASVSSGTGTNSDTPPATTLPTASSQPDIPQPGGYAKLGSYMSQHPELSIFRRFGAIGMESLLQLQVQLVHLERRLRQVQAEDRKSKHCQSYDRCWNSLSGSASLEVDDRRREQYNLMMSISALKIQYGTLQSLATVDYQEMMQYSNLTAQKTRHSSLPSKPSPCVDPTKCFWRI
jgi:hypothetical protein